MKKFVYLIILFTSIIGYGQINDNGSVDGPMTTAEILAFPSPLLGQTIYSSDTNSDWQFNGTIWVDTGIGGPSNTFTSPLEELGDTVSLNMSAFDFTQILATYPNLDTDSTDDALDVDVIHKTGDEKKTGRLEVENSAGPVDYLFGFDENLEFRSYENSAFRKGFRLWEDTASFRFGFIDNAGSIVSEAIHMYETESPTRSKVEIVGRLEVDDAINDEEAVNKGQMDGAIAAGGGTDDQIASEVPYTASPPESNYTASQNDVAGHFEGVDVALGLRAIDSEVSKLGSSNSYTNSNEFNNPTQFKNIVQIEPRATQGSGTAYSALWVKDTFVWGFEARDDNSIFGGLDFSALTVNKDLVFTDTDVTWNGTSLLSGGGAVAKSYISETGTSRTLTLADASIGNDIKKIKFDNAGTVTIDIDATGLTDTHYFYVQQKGAGELRFSDADDIRGATLKLGPGNQGQVVTIEYNGGNYEFACGNCDPYTADVLADNAWVYFNTNSIDPADRSDGATVNPYTDLSDNAIPVITVGTPVARPGAAGGAWHVEFQQSDDYFNLGDPASFTFVPGTTSMSGAIRFGDVVGSSGTVVSKAASSSADRAFQLYFSNTTTAFFVVGGTSVAIPSQTYDPNSVLVFTISPTVLNAWIDGTQVITNATIGSANVAADINIGARTNGGNDYNGEIDVLQIEMGVYSAQKISDIWAQNQIN